MKYAFLAIPLAGLMAFAGVQYKSIRTRLINQRSDIAVAWNGVEDAMRRRGDLIFSLVAPVKGLSAGSADVVDKISEARARLAEGRTPQEKMAAYDRLDAAISRLLAVVHEERPLRSGAKSSHLPDAVSNTETEVNVARQRYNESLQNYNTTLQLFPNNIVARLSGFKRNDAYIQTEAGAGQATKGQF